MPRYTKRKLGEIHEVTEHATLWEKFTDGLTKVAGFIVVGTIVIYVIARMTGS